MSQRSFPCHAGKQPHSHTIVVHVVSFSISVGLGLTLHDSSACSHREQSCPLQSGCLVSHVPEAYKHTSIQAHLDTSTQHAQVNASDSRGKSDREVRAGMNGRTSNMVKELVTNRRVGGGEKAVLIMDEVDGMSGGDRGGVAELIATIQKSRVPIICICNDKYDQKLKSLVKHCMELGFAKPTKQQVRLGITPVKRKVKKK